jgi:hypothetical protein
MSIANSAGHERKAELAWLQVVVYDVQQVELHCTDHILYKSHFFVDLKRSHQS